MSGRQYNSAPERETREGTGVGGESRAGMAGAAQTRGTSTAATASNAAGMSGSRAFEASTANNTTTKNTSGGYDNGNGSRTGQRSQGIQPAPRGQQRSQKASRRIDSTPPVLWADDGKSINDYTFYREGTPPPVLPPPQAEKPKFGFAAIQDAKQRLRAPMICGLRRRIFLLVLAAVVGCLVLTLALGVGLGVGLNKHSKHGSDNGSPAAVSTSPSPVTEPATSTHSTPAAVSSPTPSTSNSRGSPKASAASSSTSGLPKVDADDRVPCPLANNTRFDVPRSDKSFFRICGVDYLGDDDKKGATDIGSVYTNSMEDCMINCAGYPGCTGCGWGLIPGDPGGGHRCWLKNHLKKARTTRSGWEFAIMI